MTHSRGEKSPATLDLATLRADVLARESHGPLEVVAFWGHTPEREDVLDPSCLSQWWPAPFVHDGDTYATAEHWMMVQKARLFQDAAVATNILADPSPKAAKAFGRTVRGYDGSRWEAARFDVVVAGNLLKFTQHLALRAFLLGTEDRVLVEASPVDAIWGVGLSAKDADVRHPSRWRGQNLLGFALMHVRATLVRDPSASSIVRSPG
jgi:ribA/ribD-fused uncharacterized protein